MNETDCSHATIHMIDYIHSHAVIQKELYILVVLVNFVFIWRNSRNRHTINHQTRCLSFITGSFRTLHLIKLLQLLLLL